MEKTLSSIGNTLLGFLFLVSVLALLILVSLIFKNYLPNLLSLEFHQVPLIPISAKGLGIHVLAGSALSIIVAMVFVILAICFIILKEIGSFVRNFF